MTGTTTLIINTAICCANSCWLSLNLDEALDVVDPRADEILHVHSALAALASESPIKAELVKLRYFCGLSHQDAAESLGISRATADRYWAYAKAFLFAALRDQLS